MPTLDLLQDVPERAMAVCAHPDDAELGAGATLAKWIARGAVVTVVVCTSGAAGSANHEANPADVAQQRRREQEAAAAALGVQNLVFLGLPDGGLEDTVEFRGQIVRLIRLRRPVTVLTHDPYAQRSFVQRHRDHRIVGAATLDAVYPYARDGLHYREQLRDGLEPHKVSEVLLWGADEPDSIVDVSGFVEAQAAGLSAHGSQLRGLLGTRSPYEWLCERSSEVARGHAFVHGEAFRRMQAPG